MNYFTLSKKDTERSAMSIIVANSQEEIIDMNYAAEVMTGYEKKEVLGKHVSIFRSEFYPESIHQIHWDQLREVGIWEGEMWNRHKNGDVYLVRRTGFKSVDEEGQQCFVFFSSDITDLQLLKERQHEQVHKDVITGLPSMYVFREMCERTLRKNSRKKRKSAMVFLDINRFRHINDSFGYTMGDLLLRDVAAKLRLLTSEEAVIARFAGDLFSLFFPECPPEEEFVRLLENISQTFEKTPFMVSGQEVYLTTKMGISFFPANGRTLNELFKNADMALSRSKENKTEKYHFYTKEMNAKVFEKLLLETHLRKALEKNEFSLHYQPQVNLQTGKIVSAEALIRWNHPTLGAISPAQFIPVAEETGFIVPLGNWVIEEACRQAKKWIDSGVCLPISVNLSSRQFQHKQVTDVVKNALDQAGISGKWMEIEITESMIMNNLEEAIETLGQLKELGLRVSIDDFGTGYSSLGYLAKFPLDALKIDRSFIQKVHTEKEHGTIASIIIHLAHELGLEVVAEGVEEQAQADFLRTHQCEKYQGYYCSPPLPPAEFEALFSRQAAPAKKP